MNGKEKTDYLLESDNIPSVIASDLSFSYNNGNCIMKNVNFKIYPGEIVGIVGPSGCGKSTLGYIMKGLIPNTIRGKLSGNLIIDNLNIKKERISTIAKSVGMVFQDVNSQLFSNTVLEEVEFGLRNLKLNIAYAIEALEKLDIQDLTDAMPMNLSAGQKQRVILASVIAPHPKILILDEPSIHLDPQSKKKLKNWLFQLNQEMNTTIIMIEHDSWLIGELCSSILLFSDYKIERMQKERILEKKIGWCWIN